MISLACFETPAHSCSYLPEQQAVMEYDLVGELSAAEYESFLERGYRRFGHMLFRPVCPGCTACHSVRIDVHHFRPNRSQKRNAARNRADIDVVVGQPRVTDEKLALYDRFHEFQAEHRGWPGHSPKNAAEFAESFVNNPFRIQEWQYYLSGRLVGLGYADDLPRSMSAIYFVHDPTERGRGLGIWNVLCLIESASRRGLPFVYLGFHVAGCRSLEYKADFIPNQRLIPRSGVWTEFRSLGRIADSPSGF